MSKCEKKRVKEYVQIMSEQQQTMSTLHHTHLQKLDLISYDEK